MSGVDTQDFIQYWETEGAAYARQGDYAWMASLVPGKRVLEIGCGLGFGTQALAEAGCQVLAVDLLEPCLEVTRQRLAGKDSVSFLQLDLTQLSDADRASLTDFAPEVVVCWLMGAPQDITQGGEQPSRELNEAVAAYREKVHRQVAELALSLPSVQAVHLVDRTAIPWQAKDLGRDTLVRYHQLKTFADLPFVAERRDALYRKLEGGPEMAALRRTHPALKSVTPVLASLLVRRKTS